MERWSGRVALVTGASSGIGAELCRALVRHGMVVVGIARRVDRMHAVADEESVKNAPGKLVAVKLSRLLDSCVFCICCHNWSKGVGKMDRWNGRVALVTGASSGIGAALCQTLVQHGMKVVGCSRNVDRIKALAEEDAVKKASGELMAVGCDLRKESDILSTFDEIRRTFGRLDICINNAGLGHDAPLLSGKTSDFKDMLDVNVLGLTICTREAVKLMKEKAVNDGQIIQISSIGGHFLPTECWVGASFYCGTKFMVRALTEGLRRELKELKSNIKVASISPGLVQTGFFDNYLKDNSSIKPSDLFHFHPLQPKDIADSVLHILSTPQHVEVHDIIVRPYTS